MGYHYYDNKLSAEKLKRCYEIAPARVKQYLEAEIKFVLKKLHPLSKVLELGCGYGRVLAPLTQYAGFVVGIDTSFQSLLMCRKTMQGISNYALSNMDAVCTGFPDRLFDTVVCIQNGISAFNVNQSGLIKESIRITKPGGTILFSSYSDKFWAHRLQWFEMQSRAELIGKIDTKNTRNGKIICKDGFTAGTVRADDFKRLISGFNVETTITEVDESSVFFIIKVNTKSK